MKREAYDILIGREAAHWSVGARDADGPQIWDDEQLFEIFYGREYRHLLGCVQESGPRVLELGCGNGGTAIALAERGLQVTGIDLSPVRIDAARKEAIRLGLAERTVFIEGDLNLMPLPASSYDCVVAHDALHHILELGNLLDRVRGALVPGGRLVVMDFVGMGRPRRIMAAVLFALLPTHRSYRSKWGLRRRLGSFLASERRKRDGLARGSADLLHADSPFEEISGPSIPAEISSRFRVGEYFTFCPFWYYLAPKLRLPRSWRYPAARALHRMDGAMLRIRPRAGAHIFMTAYND